MDNKAWPWKKKSMEKTIVESNGLCSNREFEKLVDEKIELENRLKSLNEKLTFVEAESNKHETKAKEAIFEWEKAKAESTSLKKKLEEALNEINKSDEQEKMMHDALRKLADTGKRLEEVEAENNQLSKALLAKNKTFEDLNRDKDSVKADINALVSSLESKEKQNLSLRYEVRVLEKELELRNEEREFTRRTSEASHKLHLENVKKVAKLETECQRLRILVRKRLPGPVAVSKMRNEVEMLGRRRVNGSSNSPMIDTEKIHNLTEQLCLLEEENKSLREALNKKVNELQFSRTMYSRTASRLLEFESHQGTNIETSRSSNVSHEVSLVSVSEFDNEDKVSCADSWASALLSELESFKNKKQMGSSLVTTPKASEMKLMDDFAEMEKLAMVTSTIDNRPGSSSDSISSEVTKTPDSMSKSPQSLHVILKAIAEHKRIEQRNTDQVLEDIRKALNHQETLNLSQIATQVSSNQTKTLECDISKSIRRIIEIIEGESLKDESHMSPGESERLSGYTARVLQWKTSELSNVSQRFLHACYDLLDEKTEMKKFVEELTSVLEWMVNHCFSLQDVSSMREQIKKQFEWDESRSGSEVDIGLFGQVSEADKLKTEHVSLLASKDQSVEDKPSSHKLSSNVVEEEAKEKTKSEAANELKLEEKQNVRTELEITAASEKLAECQETILNLGKQLKALTNSKETALLSDKLMSDLTDKSNKLGGDAQPSQETKVEKRLTTQRSSLLDQMKAEDYDNGESKDQKPQAGDKNGKRDSSVYNETIEALEQILLSDKTKGSKTNCFTIVPQKKRSGGVKSLWRKLLGRKKKNKTKKLPNPFAT